MVESVEERFPDERRREDHADVGDPADRGELSGDKYADPGGDHEDQLLCRETLRQLRAKRRADICTFVCRDELIGAAHAHDRRLGRALARRNSRRRRRFSEEVPEIVLLIRGQAGERVTLRGREPVRRYVPVLVHRGQRNSDARNAYALGLPDVFLQ